MFLFVDWVEARVEGGYLAVIEIKTSEERNGGKQDHGYGGRLAGNLQ